MSAIWVYILVITLVIPILPMVGNMGITNLEGIHFSSSGFAQWYCIYSLMLAIECNGPHTHISITLLCIHFIMCIY